MLATARSYRQQVLLDYKCFADFVSRNFTDSSDDHGGGDDHGDGSEGSLWRRQALTAGVIDGATAAVQRAGEGVGMPLIAGALSTRG